MRDYEVHYVDGSVEILAAEDISEAKEKAEGLLTIPVTKVVALPEPEEDEDSDDDDEDDDDGSNDSD